MQKNSNAAIFAIRADIREVLVDDPEDIWNRTNEFSGITKDFFDTYMILILQKEEQE